MCTNLWVWADKQWIPNIALALDWQTFFSNGIGSKAHGEAVYDLFHIGHRDLGGRHAFGSECIYGFYRLEVRNLDIYKPIIGMIVWLRRVDIDQRN